MVAGFFADLGYTVDAIDPEPPPQKPLPQGITFHQTTLEAFKTDELYDLVLASFVSMFVSYDVRTFIERLKSLMRPDGLTYLTLLGDEDEWADKPWSKSMTFEQACSTVSELDLRPIYRSVEWSHGRVYSGEPKFWHIYTFVLEQLPVDAGAKRPGSVQAASMTDSLG